MRLTLREFRRCPQRQAFAVAGAVAGVGRGEQAEQVALEAEQVARSITDPFSQARSLVAVAGALAGAGRGEQAEQVALEAEQVARSIVDPYSRAQALVALVAVAGALAGAGQYEQAEQAARSITDPDSPLCHSPRRLPRMVEAGPARDGGDHAGQ